MSDYGGFRAIVREAQALQFLLEREPEVACPRCGELLQVRSGEGRCPFGHYRTTNVRWS